MFTSYLGKGTLELLEYFWNNTDDNMFIVALNEDNDFYIEEINPSQANHFNLDINAVKNKTMKELLGKDAAKRFEEKYHRCIKENRPVIIDEKVAVDNEIRYWNTMVIPMHDKEKNIYRVFGIAREFTELINARNDLEKLNLGLEKTIKIRTSELEEANKQLLDYAYEDPLTKIGNRRYFFEKAHKLIPLSKEIHESISLIYIDLDYFKLTNDTYGHTFGDKVLVEFANILKTEARDSDIICRFGGEEFVLLLPSTTMQNAIDISKRIQEKVRNHAFLFKNKKVEITSSMGIAQFEKENESLDSLIHRADKALYSAKNKGRNRISLAGK